MDTAVPVNTLLGGMSLQDVSYSIINACVVNCRFDVNIISLVKLVNCKL